MDERVVKGPGFDVLDHVSSLLSQRETQYGNASDVYRTVGALWDAYLKPLSYGDLEPRDVLVMMALMKIGRIAYNPGSEDHYVDAIGYMVLAHEAMALAPKRAQHGD